MSYKFETIYNSIDNFKSNNGSELSPKTIVEYKKKFSRLNDLQPEVIQALIEVNQDKKRLKVIVDKIKSTFKNSKDYFSVLSKVIKNYPGLDTKISDYVKNRINQIIKEEVVKNIEKVDLKVQFEDVKINWSEYVSFVNRIIKKDDVPLNIRIMFSLYKEYPLRDDFGDVIIVDDDDASDDNVNFYNRKTKILHLNKYKTVSTFGPKLYKIPDYISDMVNQQNSPKYLVGKTLTKPYSQGKLSTPFKYQMKKYFGKSISINDLRHSVITYYNDTKTIKKQKQLASIMLHSYATQYEIYNRK